MSEIRLITSNLIGEIKELTQKADNIYWIVAFAMKSGVRLVLPHLKEAAAKDAEIKILIGDYLHITQPEALDLLFAELPNAEIRLFQSRGVSFHPKAYLFRTDQKSHVIVGSSNLYASSTVDENIFESATLEFMKQFLSQNTLPLNQETLIKYKEAHRKSNLEVAVSEVWAHNDEIEVILEQAQAFFKHVHPIRTTGIYNGFVKRSRCRFSFCISFHISNRLSSQKIPSRRIRPYCSR